MNLIDLPGSLLETNTQTRDRLTAEIQELKSKAIKYHGKTAASYSANTEYMKLWAQVGKLEKKLAKATAAVARESAKAKPATT